VERKLIEETTWLALFKFLSQVLSWCVTILVARILVPEDYGLMEMATVITGYAVIFSELGLGAAIIQKPRQTKEELSSVFWFAFGFSLLLAMGAVAVAYPTAAMFNEPRVIPITQSTSILFATSGMQIVPLSLLKKELEFKTIGKIEMLGVAVSSLCMYLIAKMGGGVWTLIGGHIIRNVTKLILVYLETRWRPSLHFRREELRGYVGFGITVALGQSLFYVYDKSDRFFAARAWPAQTLGYYSFALELAKIPTEKIVVLINQVSFPALSKLQDQKEKFRELYLGIIKVTACIVFPLFVGGFLVAEELVRSLLNERWYPMINVFRYLCLAQMMTALSAINNSVHTARGRPGLGLFFNAFAALAMPVSFYFAARHGLNAILVPWFTTYMILSLAWIGYTLQQIDVGAADYFRTIRNPFAATAVMVFGVIGLQHVLPVPWMDKTPILVLLFLKGGLGAFLYVGYLWLFDRKIFHHLKALRAPGE